MVKPKFVIWEQSYRWAAALRPLMPDHVRICEVRAEQFLWQIAGSDRFVGAAVEIQSENLEKSSTTLVQISRRRADVPLAAILAPELLPLRWTFYELGATHLVFSVLELPTLVDSISRFADGLPDLELELPEKILAELPWPDDV